MPLSLTTLDCGLLVEGIDSFSLPMTLDCGQCFTFSPLPVSDCIEHLCQTWRGTAGGQALTISQRTDGALFFHDTTAQQFDSFWRSYFDLDTDYAQIKAVLAQDATLQKAITYAPGIRILRQRGWEALCCFIISQNNNIKRIHGIVERLCQTFGEDLGNGCFSFPSPQRLAACSLEDLAVLRSGFRAKYLLDAAALRLLPAGMLSHGRMDEARVCSALSTGISRLCPRLHRHCSTISIPLCPHLSTGL